MPRVVNYANRISNFNKRTLPPQPKKPSPPQSKSKCQKNPDSLECLEEQLSNLRSQTSRWNIGGDVSRLQALIQKKRMIF